MMNWFTLLFCLAVLSHKSIACDIDMPNILLSVQFAGNVITGSQQFSEFIVPLYLDCNNYVRTPGEEVLAGNSIPSTAIAVSFPGDGYGFSGSDGLLLNTRSLDSFISALSAIGVHIDVDTLLSQVICTVVGSDGIQYSLDITSVGVLNGGAAVSVASYQCGVTLGDFGVMI